MGGRMTEFAVADQLKFDNDFVADGIDLSGFGFPKPSVRSWSVLAGKGVGSVTVEAEWTFPGKDYPTRLTLARTEVLNHSDKPRVAKQYQSLVEEWNKNNRANWIRIFREAVEYVASYHERQMVESRRKFDMATANLDVLAEAETHEAED